MARPMDMFKVIKINNSWNLGHHKGSAPLLLTMEMCDDWGAKKASCQCTGCKLILYTIFYKDDKALLFCEETLIYVMFSFAQMTFNVSEALKIDLKNC